MPPQTRPTQLINNTHTKKKCETHAKTHSRQIILSNVHVVCLCPSVEPGRAHAPPDFSAAAACLFVRIQTQRGPIISNV